MGKIVTTETTDVSIPKDLVGDTPTYIDPIDFQNEEKSEDINFTDEYISMLPIKRHFGIDSTDTDLNKQVKEILQWAKDKGLKHRNQVLSEIKKIEYKLGQSDDVSERVHKVLAHIKYTQMADKAFNKLTQLEND